MSTRISRIEFNNFKALDDYSLSLGDTNILVGPNNSGKSTILGALRTLDAAMKFARGRAPARLYVGDNTYIGYRIPTDSVPISLENVFTNYDGDEARVTFRFANGNSLSLWFPRDEGCILLPTPKDGIITSAAAFKRAFPVSLVVVPVLGPIEHDEKMRDPATVVAGLSTHRASRHFRNYWHHNPDGFPDFADLVSKTWPGMTVEAPEYDARKGILSMYCRENNITRELYWVGFGFQIWCQLLTHLTRATNNSLVLIDEPEIYLHPDVQRQLLGIMRDAASDILIATHSSEIIAEADPSEIVIVDKKRKVAERLKDVAGIQRAMDLIGSSQNIALANLARHRKVLFMEGPDDFKILRKLARKAGLQELSSGVGLTILESGGFGSWNRVTTLSSGVADALGTPLKIGAIYDRDYFCNEQITEVEAQLAGALSFSWILGRKEIENYLLLPSVIAKAITKAMREGTTPDLAEVRAFVDTFLMHVTGELHEETLSQMIGKKNDFYEKSKLDRSTVNSQVISEFNKTWKTLDGRLNIVNGKKTLKSLRLKTQEKYGVTLSDARIVEAMARDEMPADLVALLRNLEQFRLAKH